MVLQHSIPEDFIFATGQLHSVQDVVELAFAAVDLDWQKFVKRDERLIRPTESHRLVGDPSKARKVLGWQREYEFADMIREMTLAELDVLKSGS
jgi:GDPmannose 4,6-dehydratase